MGDRRIAGGYRKDLLTFLPGHKVTKANGGEGDDHKVDGLQRAPALDVLKDDGRQRHEDETPKEDEQHRGNDTYLGLADVPLLPGGHNSGLSQSVNNGV